MTRRLHAVRDTGGHSVKVPPAELTMEQITTMQHVAAVVLKAGGAAMRELVDALEQRDPQMVAACCRKLTSIGWLANEDAMVLERDL